MRVIDNERFKPILRFEEGNDIRKVSPEALTHRLKQKIGKILMAKVMRGGD